MNKIDTLNKYTFDKALTVEIVDLKEIHDETIPAWWKNVFSQEDNNSRIECLIKHWEEILGTEMRNTIMYFKEFLKNIELMKLGNKYFILYSIKSLKSDEILFYTGGNPLEKNFSDKTELKCDWDRVPERLKLFYEELHDGFYYFPSRGMGIDSIDNVTYLDEDEWGIIEELDEPIEINLKSSYGFFSNGAGSYVVIDIADCKNDKAILWSAKTAPDYDLNFWDVVDEWTVIGFD
ncbi:SMI1/KNR4 family protein [Listeria newyorkensis]|uniref:SMI1/KNR4 family protein n=1 Tax=Listeria newyorkensis TaxID=1497681 RepID=A0A841YXY6_9LIST|nr:SMI1/KNR4 family protein [Listeria newyorkensis]MBC1458178.1 SMI1/KNR4 family protein [Listeria newyorkensis]